MSDRRPGSGRPRREPDRRPGPPRGAAEASSRGERDPGEREMSEAIGGPEMAHQDEPASEPGEPVRLTITGMAYGGEAVGRTEDGAVVFVWGALPGEQVLADITDRRKRFWRGRVREVLRPSAERVTPGCPVFGICGGCQWQEMAYPAQVDAKQAILLDQVRAAYPEAEGVSRPPLAMTDPWRYRNVTHFIGDEERRPGLRRWQSHELVAIADCPISQQPINAALPAYRGDLYPGERLSLRCSADGAQVQVWRGEEAGRDERALTETVLGHRYQVSPRVFFQVNTKLERRAPLTWRRDGQEDPTAEPTSLTEDMVRLVLEGVEDFADQTVVDAYCGVGLFALPLAARAPRVVGIEESESAVLDALANAAAAGLTNTLFLRGSAGRLLPAIAEPISAVVLDPPRTGVEEAALRAIIGRGVPRLVYVSCNPATLGRDLRLLAGGGYQLDWLRLVDLFPQTLHIEAVAVLTLR